MNRKLFFLIEAVLGLMAAGVVLLMLRAGSVRDTDRICVILPDSDDSQWASLKYGFRMAADDLGVELTIVGTGGTLTAEEERHLIGQEADNGTDGFIVWPIPSEDGDALSGELKSGIPILLVGDTTVRDEENSTLPAVQPDQYGMGEALAGELLRDYSGNLDKKTIGILSESDGSPATDSRREGFLDALGDAKVRVLWSVSIPPGESESDFLSGQRKVDLVVALDDGSLIQAGEAAADNSLHGALVYGFGTSTEAVYYLDTGIAECLVVPDEFSMGYQSMQEVVKRLDHPFYRMRDVTVSHVLLRREDLFSGENQELLFMMSQ